MRSARTAASSQQAAPAAKECRGGLRRADFDGGERPSAPLRRDRGRLAGAGLPTSPRCWTASRRSMRSRAFRPVRNTRRQSPLRSQPGGSSGRARVKVLPRSRSSCRRAGRVHRFGDRRHRREPGRASGSSQARRLRVEARIARLPHSRANAPVMGMTRLHQPVIAGATAPTTSADHAVGRDRAASHTLPNNSRAPVNAGQRIAVKGLDTPIAT